MLKLIIISALIAATVCFQNKLQTHKEDSVIETMDGVEACCSAGKFDGDLKIWKM